MPRTLPWALNKAGTKSSSRQSTGESTPRLRVKHRAPFVPSSDVEQRSEGEDERSRNGEQPAWAPSSSPVGEPPEQIFMNEGLDKDDRYRMVEDEFLSTAKQFTQHLHAAEYRRMKKAAKLQNAAAINSISRPVTMKMPDATRRKVESVKRSRKQASTIQGMLGPRDKVLETDVESDGDEGMWVGTALHGLMDSPRKSAASLLKVGSIAASTSTRAAAGFRKVRGVKASNGKNTVASSQHVHHSYVSEEVEADNKSVSDTSSDDDLDGPSDPKANIKRPKLTPPLFTRKAVQTSAKAETDPRMSDRIQGYEPSLKPQTAKVTRPSGYLHTEMEDDSTRAVSAARIAKRLGRTRPKRLEKDKEEHKKNLDIIPTFL